MKQYADLVTHILEQGKKRPDRTGVGTLGVFGHQMRFDLQEGFPLVTTKRSMWKGAIEELRWFLTGSTDVKWLQEQGVTFWNEWQDDEGTIGHGYGRQFRNLEYLTPVTPKRYDPAPVDQISLGGLPEPEWATDTGTTAFKVGQVISSTTSGDVVLLAELPANDVTPRTHWRIGFRDTGYVRTATYRDLQGQHLRDPLRRSVHGVGYYGEYDQEDPHLSTLASVWRDMIGRCYDSADKSFGAYGAQGVHVCEEWQCFANFQRDAKKLDGWVLKLEYPTEYSIDKDTLWASNRYSALTCMWASEEVQNANRSNTHPFTAQSPDGHREVFFSTGDARRRHGLNVSAVHRCLSGKLKTHHGWSEFQYVETQPGTVVRYQRVDQLKQVLASLNHDPWSRRHIISMWNPLDLPRTTLPPCHGSVIQFYVEEDKGVRTLSCHMYQRSCDVFLGLPVNITVYALLTHMIAHKLGYQAAELVWTGGDCHLYLNHLNQAQLMLSREPRNLPKLNLDYDPSVSLEDVQPDQITVEGYDPHPAIKAPVAI